MKRFYKFKGATDIFHDFFKTFNDFANIRNFPRSDHSMTFGRFSHYHGNQTITSSVETFLVEAFNTHKEKIEEPKCQQ